MPYVLDVYQGFDVSTLARLAPPANQGQVPGLVLTLLKFRKYNTTMLLAQGNLQTPSNRCFDITYL